jgi:hypothetical protein
MLLPPYRPSASDPYAFAPSRRVRVGHHQGRLYTFRSYVRGPSGTMVPSKSPMFEVFVQLPAGRGKVRDLAVGSNKLTERELIKVVVRGLSSSS